MRIEREVDDAFARKSFDNATSDLAFFLVAAKRETSNLDLLIGTAWNVVSCGCVADPQSAQIPKALNIVANAHAALFVAAANPSGPVTVPLDEGDPATYTSPPDQSIVHVGRWINAFYFNVLARKPDSVAMLCGIPTDLVRRSTTRAGKYHYLYMEALQALGNNRLDTIVETLLAAVKATDPETPDVFDADWTLNLHVPQLEVLIYAVTKDAKYGDALASAVQLHKKYWEKKKDNRRRDYHGMISIELTALALIGLDRGLSAGVESPYLPMDLVAPAANRPAPS